MGGRPREPAGGRHLEAHRDDALRQLQAAHDGCNAAAAAPGLVPFTVHLAVVMMSPVAPAGVIEGDLACDIGSRVGRQVGQAVRPGPATDGAA